MTSSAVTCEEEGEEEEGHVRASDLLHQLTQTPGLLLSVIIGSAERKSKMVAFELRGLDHVRSPEWLGHPENTGVLLVSAKLKP